MVNISIKVSHHIKRVCCNLDYDYIADVLLCYIDL